MSVDTLIISLFENANSLIINSINIKCCLPPVSYHDLIADCAAALNEKFSSTNYFGHVKSSIRPSPKSTEKCFCLLPFFFFFTCLKMSDAENVAYFFSDSLLLETVNNKCQ